MVFRSLVLFLAILAALPVLGCGFLGGSSEASDEFALMEFEPDPPTPAPEEIVEQALSLNPELLVEVRFLYGHQVHVERMRQLNRDLLNLLDHGGPGEVNLDWVIDVHQTTRDADELFLLTTSLRVPESQRSQYDYLMIRMLEAVQTMGLGADRLLAAAVRVGPSGRTLLDMSDNERAEFDTLLLESRFFLNDSENIIEEHAEDLAQVVGSMRIR